MSGRTHGLGRRTLLAVLAGACLLSLVPSAEAQSSAPLRYKWTKGQVIRNRTVNETVSESATPMGAMNSTQKQENITRMTVQSVAEDGTGTVDVFTESIKLEMESPMQDKMTYDSTKPEAEHDDDPTLQAMTVLLNETVTLEISADGAIKDVKGYEKIVAKLRKSMENTPGADAIMPEFERMYGKEGMKRMMSQNLLMLTNRDTKAGETWQQTNEMPVPMLGTINSKIDYTLKGVEQLKGASVAKIDLKTALSLTPPKAGEENPARAPGMKTSMKDGEGSGEAWFDFGRGLTLKQVQKQKMTIELSMDAGGQQMTMTQKTDTTITTEYLDEAAPALPAAAPAAPAAPKTPAK